MLDGHIIRLSHVKAHKAEPVLNDEPNKEELKKYYDWYGNMQADKLATLATGYRK